MIKYIASTRLTLFGLILLAAGSALSYGNPTDMSIFVLVVPLLLLAINLLAAIVTNPRINRQSGLLVFHIGLLALLVLVAIGRLTYMDAHFELIDGAEFSSAEMEEVRQGLLHFGNIDDVKFIQKSYTVDYHPGLVRGPTRNHIILKDSNNQSVPMVIGDDSPLLIDGYRFYTTSNKGFSVILTWIPDEGAAITGNINMPSYPLLEFRQANRWAPPGSDEIRFWLRLNTAYAIDKAWVLDKKTSTGVLVVAVGTERFELYPGAEVKLSGGRLQYNEMTTWMGYKLTYDPTLKWLFFFSILSLLGMTSHFWQKFGNMFDAESVDMAKLTDKHHMPQRRT